MWKETGWEIGKIAGLNYFPGPAAAPTTSLTKQVQPMLSVTIEQGAKVRTEDCQAQNKTVLNLSGIIDNMTAAVVQGRVIMAEL